MDTSSHVTQLLLAWSDGDRKALEELTPLVYLELKKLAENNLGRERARHTLQTTALALAELDPKRGRVVELKYFGGMTLEEMAEVLGVSRAKVIREWRMAKAWLYGELNKSS